MTEFQWATLTYPDGRKVKIIIEEHEGVSPEILKLSLLYGVKIRKAQRLPPGEADYLEGVQRQTISKTRKPKAPKLVEQEDDE